MKMKLRYVVSLLLCLAICLSLVPGSWADNRPYKKAVLDINWTNINEIGQQEVPGPCACYAWAYCRTLLDGSVHKWYEYNMYGHTSETEAEKYWGMWINGNSIGFDVGNEQGVFEMLYSEIASGKPAVVRVEGLQDYWHYVAVVGTENVSNNEALSENNFLIINPSRSTSFSAINMGEAGFHLLKDGGRYQVVIDKTAEKVGFSQVVPFITTYLDKCAMYPTNLTVRTKSTINLKSLPCSWDTDHNSSNLAEIPSGTTFITTELFRNEIDNYDSCWYKVSYQGKEGYIFSGHTEVSSYRQNNITTSGGNPYPGTIGYNHGYYATWLLTSSSLNIDTVRGFIYDSNGQELTDYSGNSIKENINAKTYQLGSDGRAEPVDGNLYFGRLPGGNYSCGIDVKCLYYYGDSNGNLQTRENWTTPISFSFVKEGVESEVYTVTYDANGGTDAPSSQTKEQGESISLSTTEPRRANSNAGNYVVTLNANGGSVTPSSMSSARTTYYFFEGWNTRADGSGTSYSSGAVYSENANATLYAQWNAVTGSTSVILPTPTREGFTFKGWSTNSNDTSGFTGSFTPSGNITLYAIWESTTISGAWGNLHWELDQNGLLTIRADWSAPMNDFSINSTEAWREYKNKIKSVVCSGADNVSAYAFFNCPNLESVVFTFAHPLSIGDYAFTDCVSLSTISGLMERTTIGTSAFANTALVSFTVPAQTTAISPGTFANCKYLTAVTIPSTVQSIGDAAFYNCKDLAVVSYKGTVSQWNGIEIGSNNIPLSGATIQCSEIDSAVLRASVGKDPSTRECGVALTWDAVPDAYYYQVYRRTENTEWTMVSNQQTSLLYHDTGVEPERTYEYYVKSIGSNNRSSASDAVEITYIPFYFVYYNNNLGKGEISPQVKYYKTTLTLSTDIPMRDGYTFLGWAESADAGTATYIPGGNFVKNADTTLYAVWKSDNIASGSWGNLNWTLNGEGLLTISGEGRMNDLIIKTDVREDGSYTASASDDAWRFYKDKIKSVIISDGVTSLGTDAFLDCVNLERVILPDTLTDLGGAMAFCGCTSLTNIIIPSNVSSLGSGTFSGCANLHTINIPDGVTSVDCFSGCSALKRIILPPSVTNIGMSAFQGCTNLEEINIPDGVTRILWFAFENCSSLKKIIIPGSMEYIDAFSFAGCSGLENLYISEGVKTISLAAFGGCSSLKNVILPQSITNIDVNAFNLCTGLESITIPAGVSNIGSAAFYECANLRDVYFDGTPTRWNRIVEATGNEYLLNASIHFGEKNLKDFGTWGTLTWTLDDNDNLTISGIGKMDTFPTLEEGQKETRAWLPYKDNIKTVIIMNGVTSICDSAFQHCHNLRNVTIPESITSIGSFALSMCSSLQSIRIPESVTEIGWSAFHSPLSEIIVDDANESFCDVDGVLFDKNMSMLICYPGGRSGDYAIPSSVTSLERAAFADCAGLTSVVIPSSIRIIPDIAFYRCTGLVNVTLPKGIESIGIGSFYECEALKSITIPSSVSQIDGAAFYGCSDLTSVYFNGTDSQWSSINIGEENSPLLNAVIHYIPDVISAVDLTLPASLTTIESEAFAGGGFASVLIPPTVTTIAPDAFGDRTELIIFGTSGSYAETFAGEKHFTFIPAA